MAFSLERSGNDSVAIIRGVGDGSLDESMEILALLGRARYGGVLFDVRALTYVPTADEARTIAERYGAEGARRGWRMAYLPSPGAQFGISRMVQALSEAHGVDVAVFTEEPEALEWLTRPGLAADGSAADAR